MESGNEISDSEIKRLEGLEKIVKNFNLVVVGGDVQGGFGKLKPAKTPMDRLNNLEDAVNKFKLRSEDVNIAGTFDDGIIVS